MLTDELLLCTFHGSKGKLWPFKVPEYNKRKAFKLLGVSFKICVFAVHTIMSKQRELWPGQTLASGVVCLEGKKETETLD